ncbi:MAG: hypothetical protein ACM336_12355 [Acidobacteriota bacterium]
MPRPTRISPELLGAALEGLQQRLAEVNRNIAGVKKLLRPARGGAAVVTATDAREPAAKPRRKMSAAAKKRIAEAQRKRWAAFHAQGNKKAAKRGAESA